MPKNKEYKKLPGRGPRYEGSRWIAAFRKSCRLWLAADHILLVLSSRFNEEFKRFYFRDIQAITIRKTNSARNLTIVLAILAAIPGAFAIFVRDPVGLGFLLGLFISLGVLAVINAARGPSCHAEIKTAVQTEELSSLKRLRTARKALAILRPIIEEAQGKIAETSPVPEPPSINAVPEKL